MATEGRFYPEQVKQGVRYVRKKMKDAGFHPQDCKAKAVLIQERFSDPTGE